MNDKFMPKKPNFTLDMRIKSESSCGVYPDSIQKIEYETYEVICRNAFDEWWQKEIAPIFENAVEVYGTKFGGMGIVRHEFSDLTDKYPEGTFIREECLKECTHKALLIKVEPIKVEEETAEDLLREVLTDEGFSYTCEWHKKAKAYLERKKDGK